MPCDSCKNLSVSGMLNGFSTANQITTFIKTDSPLDLSLEQERRFKGRPMVFESFTTICQ